MSIGLTENINKLMSSRRLSADELSRRIGLPASTIKKIRNDPSSNPTLQTLITIAAYFKLTVSQLIGETPLEQEKTVRSIPVITWREAVNWRGDPPTYLGRRTTTSDYPFSTFSFSLLITEHDWHHFPKDSALLIDPTLTPKHRDFVLAHKEGQVVPSLKQFLIEDDQIYLKSVIHAQHTIPLTAEHKLLGVIVECKQSLITS